MATALNLRTIEPELRAILEKYAPGSVLEIVDSVQGWARENGVPEDNAFRQAKAFPQVKHIVLVSELTETMARSSASIVNIGPVAHEKLAQDLNKYARFLLLHEIAHLNGILDEKMADEWAWDRLTQQH